MKIKILLLLLLISLLYACTTRFIYNHLDWAIEWYVDDLVTLNEDQEWLIRDSIKSLLSWHRSNQLPFYISSLKEAEEAVKSEITLSFLKRFYYGHEKAWMNLKHHITPSVTRSLKTLSNSQVNELEDNLQSQEKDVTRDYINKSPEELTEERIQRMAERLEFWVGDLSKKQQQIVVDWGYTVKVQTNEWMKARKLWQSNFIRIVRESRYKATFNDLIMEHFQNSRKYWPDGYEKNYYFNVEHTLKMIVNIGKQLTESQKEKLTERIADIRQQLQKIHKDD